jgi:hypothetical protein
MVLNPIDLVVIPLTLVLGLKGALNGTRKELFGFVGLIPQPKQHAGRVNRAQRHALGIPVIIAAGVA